MRVYLTAGLLQAPDPQTLRMPALLDFAVVGRHDILVEPEARASWDTWLDRRDRFYSDMWRRAEMDSQQRQALSPSALEVVVTTGRSRWDDDPIVLTVDDAIALLARPLEILVEDETSDGLFLNKTVPSPLRPKWKELIANGSIRLLSLGGVTQVERKLVERQQQGRGALIRSFVLIDSDAPAPWGTPGELPRATAKASESALRHRVPVHILTRRMAENYISPPAFNAWAQQQSKDKQGHVDAFARLSTGRQHHHHLKKGIRPGEEAYYAAVSNADQDLLKHSLGDKAYQAISHESEANLRAYGAHKELTPLFQHLIRLA